MIWKKTWLAFGLPQSLQDVVIFTKGVTMKQLYEHLKKEEFLAFCRDLTWYLKRGSQEKTTPTEVLRGWMGQQGPKRQKNKSAPQERPDKAKGVDMGKGAVNANVIGFLCLQPQHYDLNCNVQLKGIVAHKPLAKTTSNLKPNSQSACCTFHWLGCCTTEKQLRVVLPLRWELSLDRVWVDMTWLISRCLLLILVMLRVLHH